MNSSIAAIRTDYKKLALNEADVAKDPIDQFRRWWDEAIKSEIEEVNAMTLATASAAGIPSARIVLLKDFDSNGFVFFTNYESHKGKQLAANPNACLVFFWKELERQVRIEGTVSIITAAESDAYFQSRPAGSRIGAWASPQSETIASRAIIEERVAEVQTRYGSAEIPRPSHWGGYLVKPTAVEFWQGRSNRLHDRIYYNLDHAGKNWLISRLAP